MKRFTKIRRISKFDRKSDRPGHASPAVQQINEVQLDHLQANVFSSAPHASLSPAHQENERDEDNVPFRYDEDEYDFEIGFRERSTSSRPAGKSRSFAPCQDLQEDNDFDFETDYNVPSTSSRPPGTSRAHGDSFFGSMDKVPQPPCSSTRAQTPYHQEVQPEKENQAEKLGDSNDQDVQMNEVASYSGILCIRVVTLFSLFS
ncbi:unnamed protein product [Caenorhabditis nigoni]